MTTDTSLYEFVETLKKGNFNPDECEWLEDMNNIRYVYHANVGKKGIPKDVTKKLRKREFEIGDTILLIADV